MQAGFPPCPPQIPFPSNLALSKVVFFHFFPFLMLLQCFTLLLPCTESTQERGLHNQAAEGGGDKKLPSRSLHTPLPSILHFQRAAFDGQQVLQHLFPSHVLTMAAADRLPPMSLCCWGTAVLSLFIPLSLGVFPADGRAGGWKAGPSPRWQCHSVLCQLSPHLQHHPLDFTALAQPLCTAVGKDPQANSKSSHQIVFLPRRAHMGAEWSLQSR